MIYLKPTGGLCNRMRTIDSMFSLCRIYKTDLTVLWIQDKSLNSPFEEIFEIPKFNDFVLKIIDCPSGFPEEYPRLPKCNNNINSIFKVLNKQIKNTIKLKFLLDELRTIRNKLDNLKEGQLIKSEELLEVYASRNSIQNKSTSEMDSVFIDKITDKINIFFNQASEMDLYITSCYRLFTRENNYSYFVPIEKLQRSIVATTNSFENVVGLHIRRSDHITSKKYSTNKKFLELVESLLGKDSSTRFFLSTDDYHTKKELLSKYGNKIITNDISSYDRNSSAAVRDAVKDLYCLAATQVVYGSHHSSFSQTAADIGKIEEITVR